jgi:hypothetical protein
VGERTGSAIRQGDARGTDPTSGIGLSVEPSISTFSEPASLSPAAVLRQSIACRNAREAPAHPLHEFLMHRAPPMLIDLGCSTPCVTHGVIEEPRHHDWHSGPAIDLVALDQFHDLMDRSFPPCTTSVSPTITARSIASVRRGTEGL